MSKPTSRATAPRISTSSLPSTDVPRSGEVLSGETTLALHPMPSWWAERLLQAAATPPSGGVVAVIEALLRAGVDLVPELLLTMRLPVAGGWLTVRVPDGAPGPEPRVAERVLPLPDPDGAELAWTHASSLDLLDDGPEAAMLRHLALALGLALRGLGVGGAGQARTEFFSRQQQLAQTDRLAAVGRLAATTFHEINNPLTAILTYADVLRRKAERAPLDATDIERLQRIEEAAVRIQSLSRGLVDYAHPSPGPPVPMLLQPVLDQALRFCEHMFAETGVTVERDDHPAEGVVRGVSSELTQVFVNLITNACQAMPRGRGRLRLHTIVEPFAIVVRLEDNGHGVVPEHAARLFEPFFTTRPLGSGTGLGLSIVRSLVERHGGQVLLDVSFGPGAAFVVRLPRA